MASLSERVRLLTGHTFLSQWTARRRFAVVIFFSLLLLVVVNVDPRIRAGARYVRAPSRYTIPVAGVPAVGIVSSWHAPRTGGRKHKGIDIFGPRGTKVLSATDGVIWSMGRNELGGNCVVVLGEGLAVYYYAHLDAWAPDLAPGDRVKAGAVLGSVGTTGNATGGKPHLHFGVTQLSIFGGRDVDPAPLLSRGKVKPASLLAGGVKEPPKKRGPAGGREVLSVPDG